MESKIVPMKIFADPKLEPAELEELRAGVAPHELLFPARPAGSVLEKAGRDPRFGEAEIAFGQPDPEDIRASENLRWIHTSTAGFTRYDTEEFRNFARERGISFTISSSVYAQACAEHALSFMLARARCLPTGFASGPTGGSEEWQRIRDQSRTLAGSSVLIAGYGGIAERLVRLLAPFGMKLSATRRRPTGAEPVEIIPPEETMAVIGNYEHVVNILPDHEATRGFFDTAMFGGMKPGAVFYNIGRGTTVDQAALHAALVSGPLDSAWLDVTEPEPLPEKHPLRALPNCHITPHTAGGHEGESRTLIRHFLENFRRYRDGEKLLDQVM